MRIYLDDDLDSNLLIVHLRREGHEVFSPRTLNRRGVEDEAHLSYAAAHALVLLTANAGDFLQLHEQWLEQWLEQGLRHEGILVVYRENNPARDMTLPQIARAVTRLEKSGLLAANTFQNLNVWRTRDL
jgi:hypothetical protein